MGQAGVRLVELFGGSVRGLLAVIVLFTFELTLFVDDGLSMMVICSLVDAVVTKMQTFRYSTQHASTQLQHQDVGFPSGVPEKFGAHLHVPENELGTASRSSGYVDLANVILYQQSSMAQSSMAQSSTSKCLEITS